MQLFQVFQRKPPAQIRTQDEVNLLREKYAAIDKITDTYAATLKHRTRKMCREMENAFVEKIAPLFKEYNRKSKLATNNANLRELERLLARYTDLVEAEIAAVITIVNEHWAPRQLQAVVYAFADAANEASRRYMLSAMIADLGYSPPERVQYLDAGIDAILDEEEENIIDYVPIVAREYTDRVRTGLLEALTGMATTAYIMSQLDEWANMAYRKCDFAALRVTGTLMSELDQQRAQNLDCTKFLWLTMADYRVRDNHKVLHNKTFNWVDGAIGAGVNGQAIWPALEWGCRCIAVPVFEEKPTEIKQNVAIHKKILQSIFNSIIINEDLNQCACGKFFDRVFCHECGGTGNANRKIDKRPEVSNPDLKSIIDDLYSGQGKKGQVGNGTMMDAIRYERITRGKVGKKRHSQKGKMKIIELENLLSDLSRQDKRVARNIIKEIKSARSS